MLKALCWFVLMLAYQVSVAENTDFYSTLVTAAKERTKHSVRYDGAYVSIPYPGGDVPADMGVCTDVIIRSYRAVGVDLQKRVHEDMRAHFSLYPSARIWGLTKPDSNIDHRRVPNLETFLSRHGVVLPVSNDPSVYQPGELVTWRLPGNLPHIGIVSDEKASDGITPLIIHNIGKGPVSEDVLFAYQIKGRFSYNQ